jgi:hypothetical protein
MNLIEKRQNTFNNFKNTQICDKKSKYCNFINKILKKKQKN